ncbi:MAG: hypothetical protein QF447_03420 [Candidatus Thioglobus sp.]|jgi:hypothetical protein|nr:hypothetical protein [Candidatus Thioglobus sp.]
MKKIFLLMLFIFIANQAYAIMSDVYICEMTEAIQIKDVKLARFF